MHHLNRILLDNARMMGKSPKRVSKPVALGTRRLALRNAVFSRNAGNSVTESVFCTEFC